MKKHSLYFLVAVMSATVLFACNGLKNMEKHIQELGAAAAPNPLELHGDSVAITITGKFPEKYFHKKASVEATPVLVYESGESKYRLQGYQGEQAAGNYPVIPYKQGKSFSYTDKVAYTPAMETSNLELRIHGRQGSKEADFDPVPVAPGVITTPRLMKSDDKAIFAKDKFVRTLSYTYDQAQINFDYNSSFIKTAELNDKDIKDLLTFLDESAKNPRMVIRSIEFAGYASPEGEIFLNDNLASDRTEAAKKAIQNLIKKKKYTHISESAYASSPKGEDWEGFRSEMEKSNIEDRNIIINVLKMTTDSNQREKEIKNISKTYVEIQKSIFPILRRTRIVVKYDLEGYSDAELTQIAASNPSALKYEELMKAGTLTDDLNTKATIYQTAAGKEDADYRAVNNLGVVYYMQNKLNDAETQWNKAYNMQKSAETSNNKGIVTRLKGDRAAAMNYFSEAGATPETDYNVGLINIQNGDYATAVSKMSNFKTFNTSLAKLLNKDNAGAASDLDASGDSSAMADYLKAVIAARDNNTSKALSAVKSAIQKDGALAAKAKKDLEFRNFKDQL